MITLQHIREFQDARRMVQLEDGRVGKIVRVDTTFPANRTVVSVYTTSATGPGIAKVELGRIVGAAKVS